MTSLRSYCKVSVPLVEIFLISQSETRKCSWRNKATLLISIHIDSCLVRFQLALLFLKKIFRIRHSETRIACGSHVYGWSGQIEKKNSKGPTINASCQVLFNLTLKFQRTRLSKKNQSIRNQNCRFVVRSRRNDWFL